MATKKKKATKSASKAINRKAVSSGSDFWKVEFNLNTLYWVVIGLAVISTAVWTYNTNQQISELYDSIEVTNLENEEPVPSKRPATPVR